MYRRWCLVPCAAILDSIAYVSRGDSITVGGSGDEDRSLETADETHRAEHFIGYFMTTRSGVLYKRVQVSEATMSSPGEGDAGVSDLVRMLLEDRRKRELSWPTRGRDEKESRDNTPRICRSNST